MIFHHSNTWKPSFIAHFTIFILCFHHVSPCSPFFNHISQLSPLIQPLIPVDPKTVWHALRLRGLRAVWSQRRRGSGLLRHGGKHLGPEVLRAGKIIDPNWWCSTAMFNYQKGTVRYIFGNCNWVWRYRILWLLISHDVHDKAYIPKRWLQRSTVFKWMHRALTSGVGTGTSLAFWLDLLRVCV